MLGVIGIRPVASWVDEDNLKSNMDRFIVKDERIMSAKDRHLKSNMDRFIANPRTKMITEGKI